MLKQERLQYLFERYLKNGASLEEELELADLIQETDDGALDGLLKNLWESALPEKPVFNAAEAESMLKEIIIKGETTKRRGRNIQFGWRGVAAAAAIFVLLFAGSYFLVTTQKSDPSSNGMSRISPESDLPPGGNKAMLTLDGGERIMLDTVSAGMITRQEGALILKSGSGQIEYKSDQTVPRKVVYNTISTPVGGAYQLTLPDGSRVWLNAASSIKFPTVFDSKERRVAITGEVYFEVIAKHSAVLKRLGTSEKQPIPFLVDIAGKGLVEVLGTHFNINSYLGEKAIKATLLEGSIRFTVQANPELLNSGENRDNPNSVLLTPGTQLVLAENGQMEVDQNADLERVLAWKNGYFMFSYDSLPEVMSQIARWYDIEVIFEGAISDRKFAGKMQRDLKLSEALKILENNHIKFKLEGRNLYVLN